MPQLVGLRFQRVHQRRMRMTQCIDGNAAGTVEIACAILGDQPASLAPHKRQVGAAIGAHHGRISCRSAFHSGHDPVGPVGKKESGSKRQTTSPSCDSPVAGFVTRERPQMSTFPPVLSRQLHVAGVISPE